MKNKCKDCSSKNAKAISFKILPNKEIKDKWDKLINSSKVVYFKEVDGKFIEVDKTT